MRPLFTLLALLFATLVGCSTKTESGVDAWGFIFFSGVWVGILGRVFIDWITKRTGAAFGNYWVREIHKRERDRKRESSGGAP